MKSSGAKPLAVTTRFSTYEIGTTTVLTLMVAVVWGLRHKYAGITGDAQLYAFQALARLYPALGSDLALQGNSQDHYTVFSTPYSWVIERLGLQSAAFVLWIVFTGCFFLAAWAAVRALGNREIAFLSVALLSVISNAYGSATVFHYTEDFFTARSVAEALVVLALACHLHNRKTLGLIIATGALAIHPLMSLPGVLLLICLRVSTKIAVVGAIAAVLGVLVFAVAAILFPGTTLLRTLMDPAWLEIVRERSQFLFLSLWSGKDLELNARPFMSLAVTMAVVNEPRIRKLSIGAMLVGASGLLVAAIAGAVGPVAILVQGQAWRWVWITSLVSVLLLVPTAARALKDEQCGAMCTFLLVSAWLFNQSSAVIFLPPALAIWLLRSRITPVAQRLIAWLTVAGACSLLVWSMANAWTIANGPLVESSFGYPNLLKIRYIFELGIPPALLALAVSWTLASVKKWWIPPMLAACLVCLLVTILPFALVQRGRDGSRAEIQKFSDWTRAIPPTSTVYVPGNKDNGHFVWLTLRRPNYLSSDQSAGAVFSREIAMEVERRSSVLLPVEDPDWKILTRLEHAHESPVEKSSPEFRHLTTERLAQICVDPKLGFVASPDDVGYDHIRHTAQGVWKGWNLYDCGYVRSMTNRP